MSNFFVALAVFVITVVGALFTVPYFIDWNGYRGVFEEEASRLLGREVRVGGAVNLHLLPTPYFRFEKVRIADDSVNLEEPFFRAESLTVKLSVPPLLHGAVEANEIEFQRPVLRLALNDKGGWNWQSFGQVLANAPYLPTNVALTSLKIKDGVLAVHGVNGAERTRLEKLDGELSSPALDGPYRFRGTYGSGDNEREIRLATAKAEGDGTVRFKASLRLADVGSVYSLDGRLIDMMGKSRMDGELTAKLPVASIWHANARAGMSKLAKAASKSGDDVAFDLRANVAADAAGATLSDLALSFEQDGRPQLLTGDVKAAWRDALAVDITLASRWLDLDRMAGSTEESSPLDSIVPLALRLRDLLPAEGRSRARFTVDQANIARESVSGLSLSLARSRDRLEVEELRLAMPGGSLGELRGVMSGPENAPVFTGNLGLRGVSVVRFLGWARGTGLPAQVRGDGPFGLRAQVAIASGQMDLRDIIGDLSGTAIYGGAQYRWEGRPEFSLTVEGPQIDVRPFVPEGASLYELLGTAQALPVKAAAGSAAQSKAAQMDARLRINAGQLIAVGRTYRDVAVELDLRNGRLRLPTFRLSGSEGYSLELEGDVGDVAGRPKGTIRALAAAETPQGMAPLAELFGIPTGLRIPERRLRAAGPLRLGGSITFGTRTPTSIDLQIDGEANGASVKASARLEGGSNGWRKSAADVTAVIEGQDAGRIASTLLGAGAPASSDFVRPGRILVKAGGVPADGLATVATIDAGELTLDYRGHASLEDSGAKIAGEIELKGSDAARVAAITGLSPPLRLDGMPISGFVKLTAGAGAIDMQRLALNIGASAVQGRISLTPAGDRRRVAADLSVGEVSVARLLGPLLDQRLAIAGVAEAALSGSQGPWPDEPFDTALVDGFEGSVKIDTPRLTLAPGLGLSNASIDIELAPGKIDVKDLAGDAPGGRFGARFALQRRPGGVELTGSANLDATLQALVAAPAGRAEGSLKGAIEFKGQGTTPRTLISAVQGKGTVELGDAKIGNLWPGALERSLEAAMKMEADRVGPTLRQRLVGALPEGALQLGPSALSVELFDGQLRAKPISIETDQGTATGSSSLDLRTLAFESDWRLERKRVRDKIDEKAPLPAVVIQYRGQVSALSALDARINTDALERELTARKMELDLEELERLRQIDEQRRRSEAERLREQPPEVLRPLAPSRPALPTAPAFPKAIAPATPG